MSLAEAWQLFQEAMPVLALLGTLLVLWLGSKFVRHKRCEEHRHAFQNDLDGNAVRRKELEKAIAGLPTAKDLDAMKDSMSELSAQVRVLQESLKGQKELFTRLESQVDRIDTFLKGVSHL